MKAVKLSALVGLFIFSLASGLYAQKKHEPKLNKQHNKWKIDKVDQAEKGEEVVFESDKNNDQYFQFPDGLFEGSATEMLPKGTGGHLTKTVLTEVAGTYTYAIFMLGDNMFAETNSPPIIIIK